MKATTSTEEIKEKQNIENVLNLLQHAPISLDDVKNDQNLKTVLDQLVSERKAEIVYRLRNQKRRRRRIYLVSL